jgi:hybrid cluster-associated redox disulfide protein
MPVAARLTIAELLEEHPAAAAAFGLRGMACVGCPMARFETLAEVAEAYAVELDALLEEVMRCGAGAAPALRASRRGRRPVRSRPRSRTR